MTGANKPAGAGASLVGVVPDQREVAALSPEYARIQQVVEQEGLAQMLGLDEQLSRLATLSAQCVNRWDVGLQEQLRAALNLGISPQKLKGVFIQLLFYAGIPATVAGLIQTQRLINERKEWQEADTPIQADWLDTLEAKLQRGSAIRKRLWGEAAAGEIEHSLAQQMVPEAAAIVDGYNFGEIWARADLEPKERMACVLAALLARRHLGQLRQYIGYALRMGFNRREICEVIALAGWNRGWPHVEEGLAQARAAFAEHGG